MSSLKGESPCPATSASYLQFCNADAAPTRGWVRATIHSETNQGFVHWKQNFRLKKCLHILKQKAIIIGKQKGTNSPLALDFSLWAVSLCPPKQPKKPHNVFKTVSFLSTKITFWAKRREKLKSTIKPSLLWVVLGSFFPQQFPEHQGDKAPSSHWVRVHLTQGSKA